MNDMYRKMSIVIEVQRAVKYLRLGLTEIQKISGANDFYDPVFIYLSGGLERLFKSMLCMAFEEKNKRLPNTNEIWNNRNGHDLIFLKDLVARECFTREAPIESKDYLLVASDEFVHRVCKMLSEYGKYSRYFNLDAILGKEQEFNTKNEWERMEVMISKEIYGEKEYYRLIGMPSEIDRIYDDSNCEIVIRLERFFRALTRQFIFGDFSSQSISLSFEIEDFSDIEDKQLGKTDYRKYKIYERIKRSQ